MTTSEVSSQIAQYINNISFFTETLTSVLGIFVLLPILMLTLTKRVKNIINDEKYTSSALNELYKRTADIENRKRKINDHALPSLDIKSDEFSKENNSKTSNSEFISLEEIFEHERLTNTDGKPTSDWRIVLISSKERLSRDLDRLMQKSTNSLSFGIAFSIIAVIALVFILFFSGDNAADGISKQLITYIPRFTIAVILQVVAIFFLRLHTSIENDIKHKSNEITNIELKLTAGLAAIDNDNLVTLSEIWAKEERNFVINKDQRVASHIDSPEIDNFISVLSKLNSK